MNYARTWLFLALCIATSVCLVVQAVIVVLLRYLQTSITLAIQKGDPTADSLAYILSICLPTDYMTDDRYTTRPSITVGPTALARPLVLDSGHAYTTNYFCAYPRSKRKKNDLSSNHQTWYTLWQDVTRQHALAPRSKDQRSGPRGYKMPCHSHSLAYIMSVCLPTDYMADSKGKVLPYSLPSVGLRS